MKRISLLLALLLCLSLCSCTAAEKTGGVAATTLPVYQFTSFLCQGTDIPVTRLVTESVSCLHDYSLQVNQVKAVEAADYIVISGAGLEDFMAKVLKGKAVMDASAGIELLESCHGEGHEGHSHEHDPHLWLAPEYAYYMAKNICQGLKEAYPAHGETFEKNLGKLTDKLIALQLYGLEQLGELSCRKLIPFHDGFTYLAHAFDLEIVKTIEEESGAEASAKELIELIELVQQQKLPAIFVEENGSVSAADVISAETGAKVFTLSMALSGEDYFEAMYRNIDTLKEALG